MAKKAARKSVHKTVKRTSPKKVGNRTVSFLIGAITVAAIGLAIFTYAQSSNYKDVLVDTSNQLQR